jgi:hypothetical protein
MSGINGDKSRFHRKRKQKIAGRARNRKRFAGVTQPKPPVPAGGSKPEAVSA